jgi:hypothetical protein
LSPRISEIGTGGDCGFKHEQVRIAQPRQHLYGLLFRQNPFGPHTPLLPDLDAGNRIAPSLGPVAPFLGFGVNAGHYAAQVFHHVPGVAGLEKPLWDDALLEVDDVLVARRLRQQESPGGFRFNVRGPVFFDHLAEQSQSVNDLLLNGGPVDRRYEFVARNFRLLLREPIVALARADVVELRNDSDRSSRQGITLLRVKPA